MLGVDGEDEDLASLLQSVNQEHQSLFQPSTGQPESRQTMVDLTTPVGSQVGGFSFPSGGMNCTLAMMLQQQQEQNKQLLELLKGKEKPTDDNKRKKDDISYCPQEPVLIVEAAYKIEDDGHTKLDLSLRQRLRPINACPKEYWVKGALKQVERPILGGSLFLEHLMPGAVNEATICKHHDRCAFIELKNYLGKNSGVSDKKRKKVAIQQVGEDQYAMGVETKWESPNTVWEAMEAAMNFMAVEHMVRQYPYTGLAMMRCLHACKYFCGVAASAKQQRMLIENFFNECFKKNRERGRTGKHPVTYQECHKIASEVLAAAQVTSFTNYYAGDPYIGSRDAEIKKKNEEIANLQKEVKRLKAELGRTNR